MGITHSYPGRVDDPSSFRSNGNRLTVVRLRAYRAAREALHLGRYRPGGLRLLWAGDDGLRRGRDIDTADHVSAGTRRRTGVRDGTAGSRGFAVQRGKRRYSGRSGARGDVYRLRARHRGATDRRARHGHAARGLLAAEHCRYSADRLSTPARMRRASVTKDRGVHGRSTADS
jgi:hypothetical protein